MEKYYVVFKDGSYNSYGDKQALLEALNAVRHWEGI